MITNSQFSSNIHNPRFPPGPPSNPFFYVIPDSDLILEFSPLGRNPTRNETLVSETLLDALHTSLDYKVSAKLTGHGYKLQNGDFLVGVSHYAGVHLLTWGMWTVVLTGMMGYVQAYAGYDFAFEIRLVEGEEIEGFVIGAGFAITRG